MPRRVRHDGGVRAPKGAHARLIGSDVFEHACLYKHGRGRAAYIDNSLRSLHWGRINERFLKCEALCAVG